MDLLKDDFLPIFYCAKYKNAGKLSSHLWFFQAFCNYLEPNHVFLIDCGLIPEEDSLFQLYLHLDDEK